MTSTSTTDQNSQKPKIELAQSSVNDESDEYNRTFIFNGEDHTIGNALKHIISKYPEVEFSSYNTPHPLEDLILFHIQTRPSSRTTAVDVLRRGLTELEYIFRHMQGQLEVELESWKTNKS